MKSPDILAINDALSRWDDFDTLVDARSPAEYAQDHLPGAVNAPVLSDEQRVLVGTLYKQESGFEAKRVGAALVARNIAEHLETHFADKPRDWSPLVYCWRGGNRSGALATVLARIGWRTSVLEGGYKAFRAHVLEDLAKRPDCLSFTVIAGRTGCGKSLLLAELSRRGAQVLDLEELAHHRGSLLGRLPGQTQPSQKGFETLLWQTLRQFDASRPVFVESESRRIGTCHLPEALMSAIRTGECVVVEAERNTRVKLLLSEYPHFVTQPELLDSQLTRLTELHSHEQVAQWRRLLAEGNWHDLVGSLLSAHYDPAYDRSMAKNFTRLSAAQTVRLESESRESVTRLADSLLRSPSVEPR